MIIHNNQETRHCKQIKKKGGKGIHTNPKNLHKFEHKKSINLYTCYNAAK